MNAFFESIAFFLQGHELPALFSDASVKSFLVLALAGGLSLCCRRASAATRHLVWFLAVASVVCMPLLSIVLPPWNSPIWSLHTDITPGNQFTVAIDLVPAAGFRPLGSAPEPRENEKRTERGGSIAPRNIRMEFHPQWLVMTFGVWLVGVLLASISVVMGHWRAARLTRLAKPLVDAGWSVLLQQTAEQLRVGRRVTLLQSAEDTIPLTYGWWRPIVLLPASALAWPAQLRRMVLMHEMAHVRRWDFFTHTVTEIACILYWFNPLVWVASSRMRAERELACDDLVLTAGCKPTDYAAQLVDIARGFRRGRRVAAIAMARSSQVGNRIAAIIDPRRARHLRLHTIIILSGLAAGLGLCQGGCKTGMARAGTDQSLRQRQIARLKVFAGAKETQSRALAAGAGDRFFPDFAKFFSAAVKGDGKSVTNMYENFKRRHGQYKNTTDDLPHKSYWSPVLEVALAYYQIMAGEPKYEQLAIDGIIDSIPPGSIFFGGTDPGRGLPTAFSRSHVDADPFFTLTQNALADGTYLQYLRLTYGGKIYTPTEEDSQHAFKEYIADAERRIKENKLKTGEDFKIVDGKVQVSGQVAVMAINARLARIIFDKNPKHEFYIEESFPLEWMYPHLSPHGLIMKVNREPVSRLSDETVRRDRDYWRLVVGDMIGDWLTDDTSVATIAAFAENVYARKDLRAFRGDPRFIRSPNAQKMFSKFRSSIAGIYAWRAQNRGDAPDDQKRMSREAEFAFRQSFAICPHSPEAVFRYVNHLVAADRVDDASAIADAALKVDPKNKSLTDLIRELNRMKSKKG